MPEKRRICPPDNDMALFIQDGAIAQETTVFLE
jgi:hypothetical protein